MKHLAWIAILIAAMTLTSCISMIHRSVDRNDLPGIQQELAEGVSIEATDFRDKTPLLLAAEQGHMEIVRYLVENGADVNATTPPQRGSVTPLRFAVENEDYQMVRYLVENGAEVNKANEYGWTALFTAARVGNREIMEYLIDHGAEIDVRTTDGLTPIRIASNYGWTDIVVWLTILLEETETVDANR